MKLAPMTIVVGMSLLPLAAVTAQDIDADEVKSLVGDKKWTIGWRGNFSDESRLAYWDFRSDGSLCARLAGAARDDQCSDEGDWTLDGKTLCWKLTWMLKDLGYNSACVEIGKQGENSYTAVNEKTGNLAFAFQPLD